MIRLYALDPTHVALVRRPANRRKFLIAKSEQEASMTAAVAQLTPATRTAISKAVQECAAKRAISKAAPPIPGVPPAAPPPAVPGAPAAAAPPPPGAAPAPQDAMSAQAQRALEAVARILAPFKDQLTDADIDRVQMAIGIAGSETATPDTGEGIEGDGEVGENCADDMTPAYIALSAEDLSEAAPVADNSEGKVGDSNTERWPKDKMPMDMKKPANVSDDDHSAALEKSKDAYMDHLSGNGYALKGKPVAPPADKTDKPEPEDKKVGVMKTADGRDIDLGAFTKEQQAQVVAIMKSQTDAQEALLTENKTLIKKSEDLEARVKASEDAAQLAKFETEARGYSHLGMPAAELALVMKSSKDSLSEENFGKFQKLLSSANEQVRVAKSVGGDLFGEVGSRLSASDDTKNGSAEAQLEKLVDGYIAKAEDAGKSRAQVYAKVLKSAEGQKLYVQAQQEQDERVRTRR